MLLAVGELAVRSMLTPYGIKHLEVVNNGDKISTVVLGSSHTYYGIDAKELGDSVINMANISQLYDYDYYLLEHYKKYMPNLRRVIIPVSYFSFTDDFFEEGNEWKMAINYKVYMEIDRHSDFSKYNFVIANFDVYSGKLKSLLTGKSRIKCDSLGHGLDFTLDIRPSNWKEGGYKRARDHEKHLHDNVGRSREFLEKIVAFCNANSIEPIIITTPVWSSYYESWRDAQKKIMIENRDYIINKYNLRYYDYIRDPRFVDEDFYDVDHLSDIGATKLTALLRDTLKINE